MTGAEGSGGTLAGHSGSQREPGATRLQGHGPPGQPELLLAPVGFQHEQKAEESMEGCSKGPAVFSGAAEASPASPGPWAGLMGTSPEGASASQLLRDLPGALPGPR